MEPLFVIETPALIARAAALLPHGDTLTAQYWPRRGNVQPFALFVLDDRPPAQYHDSTPLPAIGVVGVSAADAQAQIPRADLLAAADLPAPLEVFSDGTRFYFGQPPQVNHAGVSDEIPQIPEAPAPEVAYIAPDGALRLELMLEAYILPAHAKTGIPAAIRADVPAVALRIDADSYVALEVGNIYQKWRDGYTERLLVDRMPTKEDVLNIIERVKQGDRS